MDKYIDSDNSLSKIVFGDFKSKIEDIIDDRRVVFITDRVVYSLYKSLLNPYQLIVVPDGERNKSLVRVEQIFSELMTYGADRDTLIVGIGGGVISDLTGFAASTYMRGCSFGFVPTTLLAQVDASIGGKNGVNYEGYKNLIGTINQPEFILIDNMFLKSLPQREINSGMVEAFKSGIILSKELYNIFARNSFSDIVSNDELLQEVIGRTIDVKQRLVASDEHERGARKLLNLGHTIGHAIERSSDKYNHGEAVGIGISMIADISVKMGLLDGSKQHKIDDILLHNGMPTRTDLPVEIIFNALRLDKKRSAGSISIVVIKGIEQCELMRLSFDSVAQILNIKR